MLYYKELTQNFTSIPKKLTEEIKLSLTKFMPFVGLAIFFSFGFYFLLMQKLILI